MVRGGRAQTKESINSTLATTVFVVNRETIMDDIYSLKIKRKKSKIDVKISSKKNHKTKNRHFEESNNKDIISKSEAIKKYFKTDKDEVLSNHDVIGAEMEIKSTPLMTEHPCDELFNYIDSKNLVQNGIQNEKVTHNLFLKEPFLKLNVDKTMKQTKNMKINNDLCSQQIFTCSNNLNDHFDEVICLNNISCSNEHNLDLQLSFDYQLCENGINRKRDLSPNKRRKPTTPHRILCPSPIKNYTLDKSSKILCKKDIPTITNSEFNDIGKKNCNLRRRLNIVDGDYDSTPAYILLDEINIIENQQKINKNNIRDESKAGSLLSSGRQNSHNNKKSQQCEKNKNNQQRLQQYVPSKKLTDFFPVRRSVRKTKKAVQEEIMKSIEDAIIKESEDGLKVQYFEGKGRGIIADKFFKRGEFVVEYIGDLISMNEANQREKKYSLDENAGCYMYYFKYKNQQYCIDATAESGKLGRLVNHSRNGNLITKVVVVKNNPHLVLIAKDDIQVGEELTYDYGDRSKEALSHHPWLAF